jgi:hypothetical protein
VAILNSMGGHVRTVHAALAHAMVKGGIAAPHEGAGRVRTMSLIRAAETSAESIGPPSDGRATGVRFYRWVHLDFGACEK